MGVENNVDMLLSAIDYIEENLENELDVAAVAANCFCSDSNLQKTFRYVFHFSVKEYIIKRRFSCAAKALLEEEKSILDVAVRFGYSSAEAFSRGFKRVWGITPKDFRKSRHFSGHTPKLALPEILENGRIQMRVKYDLTQLYEILQERKNCYYVCVDCAHLMEINEKFGRDAGDMVLAEIMRRIDEACIHDEDLILRVGGDEFVAFTNTEDAAYAERIAETITAQNGRAIHCNDQDISVYSHVGVFQNNQDHRVNCSEVFGEIAQKMIAIHPR